ncbi:hypothetical protein ABTM68_20895, partial [Acinetobacter baumannii]
DGSGWVLSGAPVFSEAMTYLKNNLISLALPTEASTMAVDWNHGWVEGWQLLAPDSMLSQKFFVPKSQANSDAFIPNRSIY